ncbi:lasso peptide biosynthesis B2 protein [Sphingobium lactosutens]|uniref:lasso peptide biosynthesis B2 protein n=1 Tax=Sphingobium lactosutens TaxID=522773 RepID=UPI0015BF9B79|nr:lasso peptide biosynthesis B2 protein [Sphingobium lactosutens]NWK94653.1 lasso peptide biosynthesis B2 protein [Sphingobium lactosutens]
MAYVLREGISFCVAGERHFFLDLIADRYFALGAGDERLFSRLTAMDPQARTALPLSPALARLLYERQDGNLAPFMCDAAPMAGMEDHEHARPASILVLRAALSFTVIKLMLRQRTPGQILKQLGRTKPPLEIKHADGEALVHLAAAFERVRAWAREDQCLPLSLAYARLAYAMGYRVDIVLGIAPRPFGAHCWVQSGGRVLNDRLARVLNFTPIYAQ